MSRRKRHVFIMLAFFGAFGGYVLMTLFSTATAKADTVFMLGGADVVQEPGVPKDFYMPAINNGDFCRGDNQCKIVPFSGASGVLTPNNSEGLDQSAAQAAGPLVQAIKNTPGPKKVVAISAGTAVANDVANQLANDPQGPPPGDLSFVKEGGLETGIAKDVPPGTHLDSLGYTVNGQKQTKYHETIVTQQYDAMATPPPDPMQHPLAAMNTIVGAQYAHTGYFTGSLNDPNNQVTQAGNTTNIVLPNQGELPLVRAMRDNGMGAMADQIGPQIQADIDAASQVPPGAGAPMTVPGPTLDQLINAAAPMFEQGINDEKERLVQALAPIFEHDPQLQKYVPPALINDMTLGAPVPPPAVAQDNAPPPPAVQTDAVAPASDQSPPMVALPAPTVQQVADDQPAPPQGDQPGGSAPAQFVSNVLPLPGPPAPSADNPPADGGFVPPAIPFGMPAAT